MEESQLVRELTDKLETLQHEKHRLERAIEGQADSIALKLRLTLLAAGANDSSHLTGRHSHHAHSSQRRRKLSSTSPSSSISASSTTSASSSTSFPSSPSPLLSPILANSSSQIPNVPPDVLTALRENSELRTRLANSERVNQYYQREIADLRRRCGISIDELEELDPGLQSSSHHPNPHSNGNGGGGRSISGSRRRSISSRSSQPNGSATVGSIRIPGASSVSPPSIRPSTSSYPSQQSSFYTNNGGNLPYSSSYSYSHSNYYPSQNPRFLPHSYTSSINTTLTTPSSSFPIANPPAPTPSTSLDLVIQDQTPVLPSPPQLNSSPTRGRSTSLVASTSSSSSAGGRRLDLLPESPSLPATADTPTKLTIITSLDTSGGSRSTGTTSKIRGREKKGSQGKGGKGKARALEEKNDEDSWDEDEGSSGGEGEEVDPLVFAVTNSLKKLISAAQEDPEGSGIGSVGTRRLKIKRRNRRFSNEPPEEDGEEESGEEETGDGGTGGKGGSGSESGGSSGGDGSSTTSREEDKYEEIRKEIIRLQRQIQGSTNHQTQSRQTRREDVGNDEDEEEEGLTPLSVSPGSRARSRRESSASYR